MSVSNQDDLYGRLLQVKAKLAREALHGVRVELSGARTEDVAPQQLPSAYWGQQIVLFGRYDTPGPATLTLRARISGEEKEWRTRVDLPASDGTYPELERLWALARTRDLRQQIRDGASEDALRAPIIDLGKTYSIVTDYTSMIVVRKERFVDLGIERKNDARTADERAARQQRAASPAPVTHADQSQPLFQGTPAQTLGGGGSGGGGGAGAFGPEVLVGLVGLLAAAALLRRFESR
jgi:Ca-activated chloride channel family protein